MNPRVTLGLLAVLVALGGYVYFSGGSAGGQTDSTAAKAGKDKPAETQANVFQFEDRETRRLAIERGGQQAVVEKDGESWRIQPGGQPGDRIRINGIVLRLARLSATRRIAEPGNLGDYGLATPDMTVTISQTDGTTYTLLVGAKAPADAGTYVKRPDDAAIYVVSNATIQDLERLLTEPPVEPTPLPTLPPTPTAEATPTPGP